MQRERVTEDIYVFKSQAYAQVTAGLVVTSVGAVVIDTLLYPDESRQIYQFITERLGLNVRYVINTHFHADHTTGTCLFPDAQVVSHRLCRELLDTRGRDSLQSLKSSSPEFEQMELRLPNLVFNDQMTLIVGNKSFKMWSSPGHSDDCIVCLVEEEQVLFASDTVMALPYFVGGSYDDFVQSLEHLQTMSFEHIVQGHGEIILRGEVQQKIAKDIDYLKRLKQLVTDALSARDSQQALDAINLESCGMSRILLNGDGEKLHRQNVNALAKNC